MCKFPAVQTPHETVYPSQDAGRNPSSVVCGQMLHMSNRPTQMRWITLGSSLPSENQSKHSMFWSTYVSTCPILYIFVPMWGQ